MKTRFCHHRSVSVTSLCSTLAILLNLCSVSAQPAPPAATPATEVVPPPPGYRSDSSSKPPAYRSNSPYTLEISKGFVVSKGQKVEATLGNVVDALRDLFPEANIVVAPDLAKMKVADVKLRSVSQLPEALEALRVASGYRFVWRKGWPGGAVDPNTGLPVSAAESSLYVLDLGVDMDPTFQANQARRTLEVFNLGGYFQQLLGHPEKEEKKDAQIREHVDTIEKIVLETLSSLKQENLSDNEQPSFQFHPGASLLIVIGTPESLEVARKVVNALPGVSRADHPNAQNPPTGIVDPARQAAMDAFARRYGLRNPEPPTAPVPPVAFPPPAPAPKFPANSFPPAASPGSAPRSPGVPPAPRQPAPEAPAPPQ